MIGFFFSSLPTRKKQVAAPGTIPVNVALNRYGKDMTFNHNTDTLQGSSRYYGEFMAFKYNVPVTAFVNAFDSANTDYNLGKNGRIKAGVYFPTDRWRNDNPVALQLIPDYTATTWTTAGAAKFAKAVSGQAKPARYPNHGQQMFDVSNGKYGYDYVNNVAGTQNQLELTGLITSSINHVNTNYGYIPSTFSYRNGETGGARGFLPYALGGRNSEYNKSSTANSDTRYGKGAGLPDVAFNPVDYINRPNGTRWWDTWHSGGLTQQQATDLFIAEVQKTALNHGFLEDFMHWHSATAAEIKTFFQLVNDTLAPLEVHYADYGEAIEYVYHRSQVGDLKAIRQGNDVKVTFTLTPIPSIDNTLIRTPVGIEVDLTDTYLAGKEVAVNVGSVLKKSANVVVLDVPYSSTEVILTETSTPVYLNLDKPFITYNYNGTTLNVTCGGRQFRAVVWRTARNAADTTITTALGRAVNLLTSANFGISSTDAATYSYYIGVISQHNQSTVIGPLNLDQQPAQTASV